MCELNRKSCLRAVCAVCVLWGGAAFAATKSTFSNVSGDFALDDARNWTGGVLPQGSDYEVTIGMATTDAAPYIFTNAAPFSLVPNKITQADVSSVYDLGADNRFVSLNQFSFDKSNRSITLKSGMLGVDWDSSTGDRFFIGNGSANRDSTVNVDGANAILSSSKKSNIQIGVNGGKMRVNVKNGGTLRGNVVMGNTSSASKDNVLWIEGAGSSQVVPSDGTATALIIGASGGCNLCVLTNQAVLCVSNSQPVVVGSAGNGYVNLSHTNRMEVVDHSVVSVKGEIKVADAGSQNLFLAAGGSVVTAGTFTVSATPNNHVFDNGRTCLMVSNRAVFADAGTHLEATTLTVGQARCVGAQVIVTNGASVTASSVTLGGQYSTNSVLAVTAGSRVDAKSITVGSTVSGQLGQRFVVDGGTVAVTNDSSLTGKPVFGIGRGSNGNVMEVTNGGLVDLCYLSQLRIGADDAYTSVSNRLVVSKGATFRYKAASAKQAFYVGSANSSYCGLEVDGAGFYAKDILVRVGASKSGNYIRLTNGATCEVYRVFFSENGSQGQTVDIDDSVMRLGKDSWGNDGSFTIGSSASSTNHLLHIHGPRAYLYVPESITLAPDSEVRFTVEKGGFRNTPVVYSPRGVAPKSGVVTAEHPTTIRIDVSKDFEGRGTYRLMESSTKDIDWTNVNLVYDPRLVKIVEKTNCRLTVRVTRSGVAMIVR